MFLFLLIRESIINRSVEKDLWAWFACLFLDVIIVGGMFLVFVY